MSLFVSPAILNVTALSPCFSSAFVYCARFFSDTVPVDVAVVCIFTCFDLVSYEQTYYTSGREPF